MIKRILGGGIGLFLFLPVLFSQNGESVATNKTVIFEIFDRTSCSSCKATAPKIRELMKAFPGDEVLFLEQNADRYLGNRYQRWQKKFNRSASVDLPFVMVDSGQQFSTGPLEISFYRDMVQRALDRPSPLQIEAEAHRVGNSFRVFIKLINHGTSTFTYTQHHQSLQILVYEEPPAVFAGFPIRSVVSTEVFRDINPGETLPIILETPDLGKTLNVLYKGKVPWERLRVATLADFMPEGPSGAYDQLAAAKARILPNK